MKRREFLATSSALSLPIFLNGMGLKTIERSALFNSLNTENDKVLVLIQLNGGNDGLSTVLPLDQYDKLANARPNVLIPENGSLLIEDHVALHPVMSGMKGLYDDARMTIIQGVGYPEQNRSHFRSMDIWSTGSPANEFWTTGWMGRYLDTFHPDYPEAYPNFDYPDPLAITMNTIVSETCQGTAGNYSLALTDPFALSPLATGGEDEVPDTPYGDELTFLRTAISQTNAYSQVVETAANNGANTVDYPETPLATQLKNVALLVSGGIQTKIFVCTIGGFDTHANQVENGDPTTGIHSDLLQTLSDAVAAFQQDLQNLGLEERVVGMTFSEFGRRIISNESLGTDHGSAAPMMVFGSCIHAGIIGDNPDIPENAGVQDGVAMQYDFRNVYGSVLMDWFDVPQTTIQDLLFDDFQYIPIISDCNTTDVVEKEPLKEVELNTYPNPVHDDAQVAFGCGNEHVRVSLFDALGSERLVLVDRKLSAGIHSIPLDARKLGPGTYYIRVQLEGGRQKTKTLIKQ